MKRYAALLITLIICVCALSAAVGLTAAIWESEGGVSSVSPGETVPDWNVWSKYFIYENVTANGTPAKAVVGFSGTNLDTVIFPSFIEEGGTIYPVTEIRNTVFNNSDSGNAKDIPVKIIISPSVVNIAANAFANMGNLKSVVFASDGTSGSECSVGFGAFSGCSALEKVAIENARVVKFGKYSFAGCARLTSITVNGAVVTAPRADVDDPLAFAGSGIG